jgi:hypothetical protein
LILLYNSYRNINTLTLTIKKILSEVIKRRQSSALGLAKEVKNKLKSEELSEDLSLEELPDLPEASFLAKNIFTFEFFRIEAIFA